MWLWRLSPIWLLAPCDGSMAQTQTWLRAAPRKTGALLVCEKGKAVGPWKFCKWVAGLWNSNGNHSPCCLMGWGMGWESDCLYPSPWAQSKVKSHLTTCRSFSKTTYDKNVKACCFLPRRLSSGAAAAWLQEKGVWLVLTLIALLFTAEKRRLPSHKGKAEILMLSIRNWRKELFYHTWWLVKWEGSYHIQLWSWIPALLLTLSRPACMRFWPMAESLQKSQICWYVPTANIHNLMVTTGPCIKQ